MQGEKEKEENVNIQNIQKEEGGDMPLIQKEEGANIPPIQKEGGQQEPPVVQSWEERLKAMGFNSFDEVERKFNAPPKEIVKTDYGATYFINRYMEDNDYPFEVIMEMNEENPNTLKVIRDCYTQKDIEELSKTNPLEIFLRYHVHKGELSVPQAIEQAEIDLEEYNEKKGHYQYDQKIYAKRVKELAKLEQERFEKWQQPVTVEQPPVYEIDDKIIEPIVDFAITIEKDKNFSFTINSEQDKAFVANVIKEWAANGIPIVSGETGEIEPAYFSLIRQMLIFNNLQSFSSSVFEAGVSFANKELEKKLGGGVEKKPQNGLSVNSSGLPDTKGMSRWEAQEAQRQYNERNNKP